MKLSKTTIAYLLILPAIGLRFSTSIYPIFHTIYLSFQEIDLVMRIKTFVGLSNYVKVFLDPVVMGTLKFTFFFTFSSTGVQIGLGLILALILNKKFFGREFLRSISLLPWAIPLVVAGMAARWMFNDSFGIINDLLLRIGIIRERLQWLGMPGLAKSAVIMTDIWKNIPFVVLAFLAGLQSIPLVLYEAAEVDGASMLQKLRFITLPMMKDLILIITLFITMWRLMTFDIVYVLTRGGPGTSTEVIAVRAYKEAFRYMSFGYASTIAIILLLIVLSFSFLYVNFMKETIK